MAEDVEYDISSIPESIKTGFMTYTAKKRELLVRAYFFAEKAHEGQFRESGEAYFIHPQAISVILMDLGMDADTVAAGLLHDVIEDTEFTYDDIKREFNGVVADLVDGVSKLSKMEFSSRAERQAESLRKMFLAMAKDIRVVIIKLADRLHNMRTLEFKCRERQISTARETLDIYAPLAHRLGISTIEWEMEDLSLLYLDPDAYHTIENLVALNRDEREATIKRIIEEVRARIIDEVKIEPEEIEGRPKHYYSIYRKMQGGKTFDQIYDLMAIRVIVDTKEHCYSVLGVVNNMYKPIPGRMKDYIAMPKENMYQSLHTTLIDEFGNVFEVQIRTMDMHRTSEYGIAAHWKYKEGKSSSTKRDMQFEEKLAWLRQLMEWQNDLQDANDFIETLKIDFFSDRVFVFTPNGDVIELSKGATPIDFAYAIHSEVGNRCVGAKVNHRMVSLNTELQTGNIVEVLTSPSSKGPSRDWLNVAKTTNAKNRIRQFLKREYRDENIKKGREMLDDAAKRSGCSLDQLISDEDTMDRVLKRYNISSLEDLYAAVGFGGLATGQVIGRLAEGYRKSGKAEEPQIVPAPKPQTPEPVKKHKGTDCGVIVKGEGNMLVRLSSCCNPVPGDDIIGYITRGRGVTVHRSDCANLKDPSFDPNRIIEVEWEDADSTVYNAEIQIVAVDRDGVLANLINVITNLKMPIMGVNAVVTRKGCANVHVKIKITGYQQLEKILQQIRELPDVVEAFRVGN